MPEKTRRVAQAAFPVAMGICACAMDYDAVCADGAYRRFPPGGSSPHTRYNQGDLLKAKKSLAGSATWAYITEKRIMCPHGQAAWCGSAMMACPDHPHMRTHGRVRLMAAHPTPATRPVVIPPSRRRTMVGASAARGWPRRTQGMRRLWRHHGLSLMLFGLFLLCALGQSVAGHRHYNTEQQAHGDSPIGYLAYLRTGHFVEALAENWESEFLQMAAYILLTVGLRQKGAPESKKVDAEEPVDADPRRSTDPQAPWPMRRGGLLLALYAHSLTLALGALFALSFTLHAVGGVRHYNAEQLAHGETPITLLQYLGTSAVWFESLQNWQSEFLALGVMLVLSIVLRQQGSPASKPVAAPHHETGHA